jgi:hypothetical protein
VGREEVRGVDTTHYTATVDVAKAAAAVPAAMRATVEKIRDLLGIADIPTEVWIDGDGRARRVSQTIDYAQTRSPRTIPAEALPKQVKVTVDYYDFGAPVSVSIPPSGDVVDLEDVLGSLRAGSGTQTPETRALEDRLITDVPPGYIQQLDGLGDTGPSDLEKAIRDDGGEDARTALVADGFVAGYQRFWARGEEAQIIEFLYEFRAPGGAQHYLSRVIDGALDPDSGLTAFDVPGVPGARGFRGSPEGQEVAAAYFTRGPFNVQVLVIGGDASGSLVVELARQQYGLLS